MIKMAKEKQTEKVKEQKTENNSKCIDPKCPFHGTLKIRGRIFRGIVTKKFPKRVVVEFTRTIFIRKFERYASSKTKLHARLSDCLADQVNIGDYVEIMECRPLSKIIAFVVTKKIRNKEEKI
jgi:small subunit ribosomal protein S17